MSEQKMSASEKEMLDLLESAWGVIANAGASNWERETEEWQRAAASWRESYHRILEKHCTCTVQSRG